MATIMRLNAEPDILPAVPQYQTFPDVRGHSDSVGKLEAIRLPSNLHGKSVLDIGCNEGFFCYEAQRRGAAHVVGIDRNANFIERARSRDSTTDYRLMSWDALSTLESTFDIVLLLSALHYADAPDRLLRDAFDRVSPNGMLLLECGIAPGREPAWVAVDRPRGDRVLHPTRKAIVELFSDAVVRSLGESVTQPGDPLPRFAFRIQHFRREVLLVSGRPGTGKSTLARTIAGQGGSARTVSLDHLLWTLADWCGDPALVELRMSRSFRRNEIQAIGDLVAASGLERRFVDSLFATGRLSKPEWRVIVLEGHLLGCGQVAEAFAERFIEQGAITWDVTRR